MIMIPPQKSGDDRLREIYHTARLLGRCGGAKVRATRFCCTLEEEDLALRGYAEGSAMRFYDWIEDVPGTIAYHIRRLFWRLP